MTLPDSHSPVEQLVRDWARFTRERLLRQIQRRKIVDSGELERSLTERVDVQVPLVRARFTFALHGKMVDMGVGNGVTFSNRAAYRQAARESGQDRRRTPKKWFNKPFWGRYYWLAEALPVTIAEQVVSDSLTLSTTIQDVD